MPLWCGFIVDLHILKNILNKKGDYIMRVNELVDFMNSNKAMNDKQRFELLKKHLNVKGYLGVKDKKDIVSNIINKTIIYSDGVYKFNEFDKYVTYIIYTIDSYTDLELSQDIEDDYDALCKSGLLNAVINTFKTEYDEIGVMLEMECDYLLSENNIESQIARFLDGINDKLDMFSNMLAKTIGDFDINKLPISLDDIEKIKQLANIKK